MDYRQNKFSTESNLNILFTKFLKINWLIVFCIFFLGSVGVAFLYSAAGGSWDPWAKSHLIRLVFGLSLMFIIAFIPPNFFYKLSTLSFILGVLSLIFVKFFGVGSVQRWISIGGLNFQPSEMMKLGLIFVLAKYFDHISKVQLDKLFPYYIPFICIFTPGIIVISQPDLGTGLTIILLGIAILFYVGISLKFVFISLLTLVSSIPLIWQQLYDYQKNRILVFLNPEIDNLGSGYQIIQSKIAIGSGGLFGKGYLLGSQSRLNYLPEKHTDFIFTLISEELGFFGGIVIILVFCILIGSIFKISFKVNSLFSKITVFGVGFLIFLYISLNIGMVCGLLPVVGAPLPLISYGGTSLLTILISVGVVLSINIHKNEI
ncbi:rod shape-determining protein RodA [Alphaproteobacteria bacterium]|nr:rod shape-determining protein RodA [Alphaproteobacteria bacterium]